MTREEALQVLKERMDYKEDDRIRQALCDIVRDMPYMETELRAHGLTAERVLDYLEKQKEQKPELYYNKELDSAAREFYFSGGADSPVDSTGLVPIVRMAEFGATWMKKKMEKEQKPAEWSEENEEALDMCLDAIPKKWKTKSGILLTKWLKDNLRPRWKPSEEQMKALEECGECKRCIKELREQLKKS